MMILSIKNNNKIEFISFDIFDTLLLRNVPKPTDIFNIIEEKYELKGFKQQRLKAEILARKKKPEEEVTLDEIYFYLQEHNKKYELEIEKESLYANKELLELFSEVKKMGKKIICISDMYLDKQYIVDILEKNGFDGIDEVFVSSDVMLTKEKGTLYPYVLKSLGVTSDKVIHIGDNYKSDVVQAKLQGIQAIHYEQKLNKVIKSSCEYKQSIMNNTIKSLQHAKLLSDGKVELINNFSSTSNCQIKWLIFSTKAILIKCKIMGLVWCINRAFKKFN